MRPWRKLLTGTVICNWNKLCSTNLNTIIKLSSSLQYNWKAHVTRPVATNCNVDLGKTGTVAKSLIHNNHVALPYWYTDFPTHLIHLKLLPSISTARASLLMDFACPAMAHYLPDSMTCNGKTVLPQYALSIAIYDSNITTCLIITSVIQWVLRLA